jgi:hypothetical protein
MRLSVIPIVLWGVLGLGGCNSSTGEPEPHRPREIAGITEEEASIDAGPDGGADSEQDAGVPPPQGYYEWVNRSSSTPDSFQYFVVYIPANTPALTVAAWGGEGSEPFWADLYLRYGSKPTTELYHSASLNGASNDETITVVAPPPGLWWIGIHANRGYTGVTLVASF